VDHDALIQDAVELEEMEFQIVLWALVTIGVQAEAAADTEAEAMEERAEEAEAEHTTLMATVALEDIITVTMGH
jgi:hypothetical protein